MSSSDSAEFLQECELAFKDYGFTLIPKESMDGAVPILNRVVAAYSELKFKKFKFPVIYSVVCVSLEDDKSLGIFRFAIEIADPYEEEHYARLCEYASKVAPYLLLGAVFIEKEESKIRASLSYDAIVDLTSTNVKRLPKTIFSLMSCGLMLIARRMYEIGTGHYEILEDEKMFLNDIDKLASMAN